MKLPYRLKLPIVGYEEISLSRYGFHVVKEYLEKNKNAKLKYIDLSELGLEYGEDYTDGGGFVNIEDVRKGEKVPYAYRLESRAIDSLLYESKGLIERYRQLPTRVRGEHLLAKVTLLDFYVSESLALVGEKWSKLLSETDEPWDSDIDRMIDDIKFYCQKRGMEIEFIFASEIERLNTL